MRILSDDGHQASARAVRAVRLVSTTESKTERLNKLLTVSNCRQCITGKYLIQPSLESASSVPKK